jgi:hypothetical protein
MIDAEKAQYDDILQKLTEKLKELVAENERLKAGLDAHSTLKSIYADANQPAGVRVKAASAALPHEVPRLESVPPPMDLVAEPIEPLATVVTRQRMRANKILALSVEERSQMIEGVGRGGNGSDDSND